ncbi:MAG TPA: LPS export ABC transporter periplasmic protein LptC [Puia sp.]|nr:LPS export ABC transporter periplasmic protein LptC [Puia sp.]
MMAFLSSFFLFLISCTNNLKDIPVIGKKQTSVEEGKNIESFYSADAKVKAKLTAPYMLRHITDSTYVEFPKTLHVDFYNDTMKIESKLDALYGKYREFEHKVFLKDSVVVRNILKGDTLHCDELWWDQNTQRFHTDKKVRINTKDKIIFGTGLEAAQNFSWYVIDQINGTILTPENGMPK